MGQIEASPGPAHSLQEQVGWQGLHHQEPGDVRNGLEADLTYDNPRNTANPEIEK
jgi:hypothetical protein